MQNPALAMRMPPPADVDLVVTKGLGKGGLLRYRMGIPLDADQRTRNAAALHFYTEAKRLCGHDLSMPFSWYVAHGRAEEMIRRVVDGMNENGHGWTPRLARDVLMNSCQRHVQNARRAENEVRRQSGNPDDKPRRGRPKTGRIAQRPTVRDLVANMKALPESLGKAPRSSPSTPQPKSTDTTTSQNPSGDFGSETARPTTTPVATTAAKQTRGPTAGRSERKATIEPLRSFPSPHPKVIKSAKQHRAQMAPIPSNNTSKRTRHQTESAIVPSSHTPVSMPLSAPPSSQVKLGGHIGQHRNRQSKLRADEQPQHTRISPTSKLITNSNTSMSSGSAVFSEPEVNVHYRAVVNRISTLLSKAFEYDDFLRAVHSAARKSVKGPVPSADMSIWYRRSAGKEAIIYDSDDYNKFVERMDQDDIQLVEGCVVFSLVPAARWEQEYDSAEDIHQREPTPTPLPRPRYRPSRSRQDSTSQPNHQR
ncbi:hypothetical protein BZA05DRAFT_106902 [Tricharina praecox]|uniref:uncharacterized protein n=1 Tax=Tricharina praecox TaxID=43433 RepID=UPI00221F7799|nr:uncharacterized protein BZA05DRAFT_106902 [Tricharina praecox]KAI5857800.1 hypothetical protein BZA05DRAFT_106902 [Tricharina praecox]